MLELLNPRIRSINTYIWLMWCIFKEYQPTVINFTWSNDNLCFRKDQNITKYTEKVVFKATYFVNFMILYIVKDIISNNQIHHDEYVLVQSLYTLIRLSWPTITFLYQLTYNIFKQHNPPSIPLYGILRYLVVL